MRPLSSRYRAAKPPASSPPLSVVNQAPSDLHPNARNPRQHSPKQIDQIAESIRTLGFNVPILVDEANQIIAGHGRLSAAIQLGLTQVPTIALRHLNEAQRKAFLVADNRLTEISTWDPILLRELFLDLSAVDLDFSLDITGFELPDIDRILQGELSIGDADPDDVPIEEGPIVTRRGDVWQLGDHRVICGDALDPQTYGRVMGRERATVVFSDVPYNVRIVGNVSRKDKKHRREFLQASGEMDRRAYVDFLRTGLGHAAAYSIDGALHYVCEDWRHVGELLEATQDVYREVKNCCVWDKGSGGMGSLYRSQHELVFVFKVGTGPHTNNVQLGRFGRNRSNVWSYPGANRFIRTSEEGDLLDLHPTVKPVALVADILLDASKRRDLVLDNFVGSGTTVIAAERTGRIARGIELDPRYVDLTIRRWQRLTKRSAVNVALQCTFDELQEARLGGGHE